MNRRNFIRNSGKIAAAISVPLVNNFSLSNNLNFNNTINIGIIGTGDRGGGLIPFINVIRTKRRDRYGPPRYKHVLCVPDDTIPLDHKALSIKTIRSKSFPIFGKVLGVAWKGASNVEPLVKAFSGDDEINEFVSEFGDVKINTHPNKFQGWTIEITKGNITRNHWNALQKIANYLLSSPR